MNGYINQIDIFPSFFSLLSLSLSVPAKRNCIISDHHKLGKESQNFEFCQLRSFNVSDFIIVAERAERLGPTNVLYAVAVLYSYDRDFF